ncbi:MAG: hypothetical protein LUI12_03215 [Clostridiales bacterium]|nr:hypothetical protein [Clostridiales bacterium]
MKNHIDMLILLFVSGRKQIALMADEKPPLRIPCRRFATSCSEMGIKTLPARRREARGKNAP